jgi:hypothetical protein
MSETQTDPVTRPSHYTFGDVEVADALDAWRLDWKLANVVKYVARAGRKGDAETEVQDLEKAARYLQRRISELRGVRSWEPEQTAPAADMLREAMGGQPFALDFDFVTGDVRLIDAPGDVDEQTAERIREAAAEELRRTIRRGRREVAR